jgi:hypothetical protein
VGLSQPRNISAEALDIRSPDSYRRQGEKPGSVWYLDWGRIPPAVCLDPTHARCSILDLFWPAAHQAVDFAGALPICISPTRSTLRDRRHHHCSTNPGGFAISASSPQARLHASRHRSTQKRFCRTARLPTRSSPGPYARSDCVLVPRPVQAPSQATSSGCRRIRCSSHTDTPKGAWPLPPPPERT